MRKTFLPFSPPLIGEEEIAEVIDTLRSDWITTGPKEQGSGGEGEMGEGGESPCHLVSLSSAEG